MTQKSEDYTWAMNAMAAMGPPFIDFSPELWDKLSREEQLELVELGKEWRIDIHNPVKEA